MAPSSSSRTTETGHRGRVDDTAGTALAVVVPTLNAADGLAQTLQALATLQTSEIVVVDGGSSDNTVDVARANGARVLTALPGRGRQMAAGAAQTSTPWLLFNHADSRPSREACALAQGFMADPANRMRAAYFRFRLDHDHGAARWLERWVALRCRWFALPFGDQSLLVPRPLYNRLGGFRALPLMEDVDMVNRLGRSRLVGLPADVVTSARRYRTEGYLRRGARNLLCCALYRLGVSPHRIARFYGYRG